jgi:hypothetical protein
MKYILLSLLLIISLAGYSQAKRYLYYFDKDLNPSKKSKTIFYGTGEYEDGLMKLMLYNNADKHLIMIEHFTDSTLQISDGLFQSYFVNKSLESQGNYLKGKEDGLWKMWDTLARVIDSAIYNNGEKITEAGFTYYANGVISSEVIRDIKNNKAEWMYFDENGARVKNNGLSNKEDEDKVFTRSEIEAKFPGGEKTWQTYISKKMEEHSYELDKGDACTLRFIVDKNGSVREVQAIKTTGSALAKIVIDAVMTGPKWLPAQQNSRYVTAYKILQVVYKGNN